eukprot:CAMPEP_0175063374 /NCGR_PEP_ID=MMETSP0052_2-20121109/14717_1 /TAXON_ID=51329 ORGANISM="Polytomella parva, Strain SAG 63-3" /NCGR_SAMPLE_ID=MMETSP0052_2 /ASSEMBLY_ACC=CAM_ASM_000194 /LENGTH=503 /DNA_ID=CAMNT_0016329557 /DNA_START=233 /DNA_END=1745 /DNA_ORIENTATION=+
MKRSFLSDPKRQIVLAMFLATFVAYVERVGFSISFTSLAQKAHLDESIKGSVLSAFYCGYGVSQIPGGWAAQLYGGRIMLILCFLAWSTVSIFTPTDPTNTVGIVFARVLVGLAQGFLIPAVHTVLALWIPPHEKARAVSFTTSGMYLGSAAAMSILPSLANAIGAQKLLAFDGAIGYAWLAFWLMVGRDAVGRKGGSLLPLSVRGGMGEKGSNGGGGIAESGVGMELSSNYNSNSTFKNSHNTVISSSSNSYSNSSNNNAVNSSTLPLGKMMTHPAIWAIVINNFSFHFGFYVVMNWMPTYFSKVIHSDLSSLGLAAKTLPYLTMFLMSNVGGWTGDWLILHHHYTVAAARKTVNTIGFITSGLMLMLMPAATGVFSGVMATTLTLGSLGFARGGFSVNNIAPRFAGVVMGVSNTAGTLSGVIGVAATGFILDSFGGASVVQGWYYAHALCACVGIMAMVLFNSFARGEKIFDSNGTEAEVDSERREMRNGSEKRERRKAME